MYIGPWQEYKLAQMIKVKNDIYEGKGLKLSTQVLNKHDSLNNSIQRSRISTPSTRSFSSEPIQKPYPTFNIDTYYSQLKKVESIISKSEFASKKPPLPKQSIRKRQGKSIQEKRVNKMRVLYGIENKGLEPLENTEEKKGFVEQIKAEVRKSECLSLSSKLEKGKASEERKSFSAKLREEVKNSYEAIDYEANKGKFSSISRGEDLDMIEESLNQENIDGLLQWADELPEDLSSSPQVRHKGLVL